MNILFVSHKFLPFIGGIEMHAYEVGRRMAALGHRLTILTADPSGALPREEVVAGMQVRRVRAHPRSSDVFFAPGVLGEVGRGNWDIIHVQGIHTFVPPLAMIAAVRRSVPFVLTFHSGGHSSSLRNLVRTLQFGLLRPLVRRADRLIGVSQFEADRFSREFDVPREAIVVVPNGAEIEPPRVVSHRDPDAPLIVSVGRLERYKGHQRAIAAFAEIVKARPGARMRVLGEGPYEAELVRLVADLGLTDRVKIGGVPPAERGKMGEILTNAAVVLLLSDYEAHPVAALECVSLGRPVIATYASGFIEMVDQGLLRGVAADASPRTVAEMAIEEIDGPTRSTPSVAVHDWDDCTGALLGVYADVLAKRARERRAFPGDTIVPDRS